MGTPRTAAALLSGVALLLAACSPGADDATPTARPPESAPPATSPAPTTAAPPVTASPTESTPTEDTPTEAGPTEEPAAFGGYGVSAGHPAAVEVGMAVLESGGNAADAAIATALAVPVVEPLTSGIGGGGAALVVPTEGEPVAYDYREQVGSQGTIPATELAVPGFVAGLWEVHQAHGSLPWSELWEPAIGLAEDGHPVSEFLAAELRTEAGRAATAELAQFHSSGQPLEAGESLVQTELAATLRTLAQEGPEEFYTGDLAQQLTAFEGIDAAALEAFSVQVDAPARGQVGDYQVLAPPPGSSGAAIIQLLQVAEALGVADAEPGSADHLDAQARAWQVADRTMSTLVGDPAFTDVPVEEITDLERNQALAADLEAFAPGGPSDAGEVSTTHISVVGPDGMGVSMTNTLSSFWGSRQYVAGFFLNNHLIRFEISTGPGLGPEAGRRPATWISPTVVLDDQERPALVIGTPGGRRIPNNLGGVLIRWALQGQPLAEAVAAGRSHLEGPTLLLEQSPPGAVADELTARGYDLEVMPPGSRFFGSVQALELDHDTGTVTGAEETRRAGGWATGP